MLPYVYYVIYLNDIQCGRFPDFKTLSLEYYKRGGVFDDGFSDYVVPLTPLR